MRGCKQCRLHGGTTIAPRSIAACALQLRVGIVKEHNAADAHGATAARSGLYCAPDLADFRLVLAFRRLKWRQSR